MRVLSVDIENVRSIEHLVWELTPEEAIGWHVILGENGAGKSSFLRAIAFALVGPDDVRALRQSGEDWLRQGTSVGSIGVVFNRDPAFDQLGDPGREPVAYSSLVRLARHLGVHQTYPNGGTMLTSPPFVSLDVDMNAQVRGHRAERAVWNPSASGWFAAGFGPFRRIAGGDPDTERLTEKQPRLARFLSLFDERFAYADSIEWLANLKFAALANRDDKRFAQVKTFMVLPGIAWVRTTHLSVLDRG
jgi:energy-coupling factor transporter ATP-binding protein EcfA2